MKIKTLYITNLGLLDNLAQTQILPYLEGLSQKGIEIHILSFEKRKNLKDTLRLNNMERRLKGLCINWERSLYHSRWGNVRDIFAGFIKVLQIVKRQNITVLHARASIPILIAWPVAKIMRRKIIYDRRGTMVGDFVDDVNVKNIFSIRFFSYVLEKIDNFFIKYSDATVVLSEKARCMLQENKYITNRNSLIESIPCCTDILSFDNTISQKATLISLKDKFVMCYLGSLGTCYLLKEMAAFFKVVKKRKENALFLIISHTEKNFIENILKKENLQPLYDYVIISLSPEEVPAYLLQCSFSIMFIKPVKCKIASSPTKFAESLAAGIPVVVNKGIGDIDEIILKNRIGVIVEEFDNFHYEKSFDRLEKLLKDSRLFERCKRAAEEYFSLNNGVEKYYVIYKNLIKKCRTV